MRMQRTLSRITHKMGRSTGFALLLTVGLTAIPHTSERALAQSATLEALRSAHKAAYDPRALQMLAQMTSAYTELTVFEQKTDFLLLQTPVFPPGYVPPAPLPAAEHRPVDSFEEGTLPHTPVEKPLPYTLHLILAQPNLFRVESTEITPDSFQGKTALSVSDGKILWTYDPVKNQYTRDPSPKSWSGFQKLTLSNTTIELMMVLGYTPFTHVEEQFDSARYEGFETVDGIQTDVVCLKVANDRQIQELRFYMGTENHLLYRLVVETIPIVKPAVMPKRDPLDDLINRPNAAPAQAAPPIPVAPGFEDPHPLAPVGTPMRMRLTLENHINLDPFIDAKTFRYAPPADASLYQSVDGGNSLGKLQNKQMFDTLLSRASRALKVKQNRSIKAK